MVFWRYPHEIICMVVLPIMVYVMDFRLLCRMGNKCVCYKPMDLKLLRLVKRGKPYDAISEMRSLLKQIRFSHALLYKHSRKRVLFCHCRLSADSAHTGHLIQPFVFRDICPLFPIKAFCVLLAYLSHSLYSLPYKKYFRLLGTAAMTF